MLYGNTKTGWATGPPIRQMAPRLVFVFFFGFKGFEKKKKISCKYVENQSSHENAESWLVFLNGEI